MEKEIQVKKKGRKTINTEAYEKIAKVKKGDSIIMHKKDWKIKSVPGQHMLRRHIGREFKVETLADESGWQITALN